MRLSLRLTFLSLTCLSMSITALGGQIATYEQENTTSTKQALPPSSHYPYSIHVNLGYTFTNWADSYSSYNFNSDGSSSYTFGMDASYTFTQLFSAVGGLLIMPDIDYTNPNGSTVSQWQAYLVGAIHYRKYDSLDLYMGAGFGLRWVDFNNHDSQTIEPGLLLGADYAINDYWDIQAQFFRLNSVGDDGNRNYIPTSTNLLLGIGYSFG